jgi:hypothetical protein
VRRFLSNKLEPEQFFQNLFLAQHQLHYRDPCSRDSHLNLGSSVRSACRRTSFIQESKSG